MKLSQELQKYFEKEVNVEQIDNDIIRATMAYPDGGILLIIIDDSDNSVDVNIIKRISPSYQELDMLKYVNDINANSIDGVFAVYKGDNISVSKLRDGVSSYEEAVRVVVECEEVFKKFLAPLQ